ncbi:MAG: ABC transporter substrate-binding protein [Alphaproteobacteria bacterium]|nr:ABC transporter substrate-binding protein [Alphaproteobacteria bacterium]
MNSLGRLSAGRTRRSVLRSLGAAGAVAALSGAPAAALAQNAVAAASDGVVKLGLLLDLSGPYGNLSGRGSVAAARMAVEDFGGTVLGAPVEIVFADHHDKAEVAATTARDWFDAQHVDAIMDVSSSSAALQVQAIARSRDKIVMLSSAGAKRLTGEACSPTSVHYVFDTYAVAHTVGTALVARGGNTWFFITVDYSFGYDLENDTASVVTGSGGRVLGHARHPLDAPDFSSYLLQAQQSQAKVVGFADGGDDMIHAIQQAVKLGMRESGQTLALLSGVIDTIDTLGLATAQGMMLSEAFYWDMNDATRVWSRRFFERQRKMPNSLQAGVYSATMHYLQAVRAAGTDAADPVMEAMRAAPIDDFFAQGGHIRADGVMVHDMYLFRVKAPGESRGPWDYYELLAKIPGDQAFEPLSQSRCPLIKK